MVLTILDLYQANEKVDKQFLFSHLTKYLANKDDITKCLKFIVDGNSFEFDVSKVVQLMSDGKQFSNHEVYNWTKEIQMRGKDFELTERIIKI